MCPLLALRLATLASFCFTSTLSSSAANEDELVVHVRAAREAAAIDTPAASDGSAASPFPTIEAARDYLRALRAASEDGDDPRRYRVRPYYRHCPFPSHFPALNR